MKKTKVLYVTYCSAEKKRTANRLEAIKRYKSRRIKAVGKIADREGADFAILSGKYGLLTPETKIPYYDHLLQPGEVEKIADKTVKFLEKETGYKKLIFYSRPLSSNPRLKPYHRVMETASKKTGIPLTKTIFPPEKSE